MHADFSIAARGICSFAFQSFLEGTQLQLNLVHFASGVALLHFVYSFHKAHQVRWDLHWVMRQVRADSRTVCLFLAYEFLQSWTTSGLGLSGGSYLVASFDWASSRLDEFWVRTLWGDLLSLLRLGQPDANLMFGWFFLYLARYFWYAFISDGLIWCCAAWQFSCIFEWFRTRRFEHLGVYFVSATIFTWLNYGNAHQTVCLSH